MHQIVDRQLLGRSLFTHPGGCEGSHPLLIDDGRNQPRRPALFHRTSQVLDNGLVNGAGLYGHHLQMLRRFSPRKLRGLPRRREIRDAALPVGAGQKPLRW